MKPLVIALSAGLAGVLIWAHFRSGNGEQSQSHSSAEEPSSRAISKRPLQTRFSWLLDLGVRRDLKIVRLRELDPKSLSSKDVQELFSLMKHRPDSGNLTVLEWASIANEIMEQVRRHGLNKDEITPTFLAMMKDESLPPLLRDFAAQHLGGWIAMNPLFHGAPREEDPVLITQALDALVGLVLDPNLIQTSIPGTTLRVLGHLHRDGGFPEGVEGSGSPITPALMSWLKGTISGENSSTPGLQNCAINAAGLMEIQEFRTDIKRLAASSQTDVSIRLTAIATLGHFGKEEDREFLTTLSQSPDRLRFAAQSALKHLNHQ